MSDDLLFFEEMPEFHNFQDIINQEHYKEAPMDWWIVITDVKDSTVAIENGRYKDVNTVGAATLAAIQNAMGRLQFPFVFGGDGATALIPNAHKLAVEQELSALRAISKDQFELGLRVGMVSVKEIHDHGIPVKVAKYMLKGNYPLAIFSGGALTKAEDLIKGAEEAYEIPQHHKKETNLRKLSCRWKPIESKHGSVLSLLFVDPEARAEVYREFLMKLEDILEGDLEEANPVRTQSMSYRDVSQMLKHDTRHQYSFFQLLLRMIDTLMATVLFRWGLFKLIPLFKNYIDQTVAHSDFRKFDDMLRMILDCRNEQIVKIDQLCHEMKDLYGVCFGLYSSDAALMTCYVPSFSDGSHIHFIDGSHGGYAMAAKQLKAQLKARINKGSDKGSAI